MSSILLFTAFYLYYIACCEFMIIEVVIYVIVDLFFKNFVEWNISNHLCTVIFAD